MGELTAVEKELLGDLSQLAQEMKRFRVNAQLLASARVVRKYRGQWVGIEKGQVQASGPSLALVLVATDALGIKRSNLALGFIDDKDRILLV
jgi:hypothetical protein